MMKMLLAFRASADLSMMAEKDWRVDDQQQIDVSFIQTMLNCFDESAAELMLMIKQNSAWGEGELALSALSVGDSKSHYYLKQLYALSFDRAARVDLPPQADFRFNPRAVSEIIAAYHHRVEEQSLIVMGMQSGDGFDVQTAMQLAELLQWPCITQVSHFDAQPESQRVVLIRQTEERSQRLIITAPAVLAIGNSPQASALRVPTLKQKLSAGKKAIADYSLGELGLSLPQLQQRSDKQVLQLTRQQNRRAGVVLSGTLSSTTMQETMQETVSRLYQGYLKGRIGR
ncbi:electron transfer flavoprotein subunit beta/FixA family protein [Budvicia diplopodorum]|uniref:electron transfer flavoprotein subunit beta/FixA family protein n=1 Tax=Budvicia diplopodorum TaxID=1119056 RepID=UPI00135C7891|nr:hypothetical protein [Budvicia diplopodorum]